MASLPKKLAVKRLIDLHSVDVIFIQETMIEGCVLVQELELLIHGWYFISVDAKGRSSGLILGWKSCNFLFHNAWAMKAGLCVDYFHMICKRKYPLLIFMRHIRTGKYSGII